jgi:two-component system, OmpR family, sensor kinase
MQVSVIRNLLDTARLDQGLFTIEPQICDLTILAEETVALMRVPNIATPVHLRADPHVLVQADQTRLRQVIENLLENALLHAPSKTPVSVTLTIERQAAESDETANEAKEAAETASSVESRRSATPTDWAVVTVENKGPGIPPDLLPHLFERFIRGQRSLGLGLGPYVSRQIALAHGGALIADSTPGHGARFTLRIPLSADVALT